MTNTLREFDFGATAATTSAANKMATNNIWATLYTGWLAVIGPFIWHERI